MHNFEIDAISYPKYIIYSKNNITLIFAKVAIICIMMCDIDRKNGEKYSKISLYTLVGAIYCLICKLYIAKWLCYEENSLSLPLEDARVYSHRQ